MASISSEVLAVRVGVVMVRVGAVATAYMALRYFVARFDIARRTLESRRDYVVLVKAQYAWKR